MLAVQLKCNEDHGIAEIYFDLLAPVDCFHKTSPVPTWKNSHDKAARDPTAPCGLRH